ncbi:hypothetical protein Taro_014832 [Colocasia esculenta]|uniref:Uncharacterized protein n=1 Tax=Colocasia esculenta TaxID=4460 RepID=A0A843UN15_COLES|nr:hypothetical protein [Colocasia esculenta]
MKVDVVVPWTRSLWHSSGTERRHSTLIEGVVASAHAMKVDVVVHWTRRGRFGIRNEGGRRSSLDEMASALFRT